MKSIQTLLTLLTLFIVTPSISSAQDQITLKNQPYLPGRQEIERFLKDKPDFQFKGQIGFTKVPLSYDNVVLPSMEIFYRLPKPIDPSKPSVLYFNGGPGGTSLNAEIEAVMTDFNVIYMDQRGTGFSKPDEFSQYENPDYFSSEFIAKDAATLLQRLGIEKVTVYGMSYGTVPATIFANRFPNLTRSVILEGVIYTGEPTLWNGPHRVKLVQKFFDSLPADLQQKILDLSASQKVDATWFSLMAQGTMYPNDFKKILNENLERLFKLDEAAQVKEINDVTSGRKKSTFIDSIYSSAYMFHHIACKELSGSIPGSSMAAEFVNGKLQAVTTPDTLLCPTILAKGTQKPKTYMATDYPLTVPITYFQGTWDGATPAPDGIHHYKNVPKSFSQLILVKKSGHAPLLSCLNDGDPLVLGYNCPPPAKLKRILQKAVMGQLISKEELKAAQPNGNWVMTSKN